jgi:hypothetical protein
MEILMGQYIYIVIHQAEMYHFGMVLYRRVIYPESTQNIGGFNMGLGEYGDTS